MKSRIIIIFLFVIALISLSLYYTYAVDVKMDKTTGTDDYTFNISVSAPTTRTVTVPAYQTKQFDFFLTNNNGDSIKYALAYSGTLPAKVSLARAYTSPNAVSGTIANATTYQVSIIVENRSSASYTTTIAVVPGYAGGGTITAPSGYTLITGTIRNLPVAANTYITSKSLGESWEAGASGVYKTNGNEWRYVGVDVDNWVKFNNDMYRIIGVFNSMTTGTSGNLVKLIKANPIGSYSWGCTNAATAYTTYSTCDNNWTTANAYMLLNQYFYNATNYSSTYKYCSYWTYFNNTNDYRTKDCGNIMEFGLKSSTVRSNLQSVKWNKLGPVTGTHDKLSFYTAETSYIEEVVSAIVGLMYASDYLYASGYFSSSDTTTTTSNYFANQNWLFSGDEWVIDSVRNSTGVYYINSNGSLNSSPSYVSRGLRPVIYLKSSTKIRSGNGTFKNPYVI